MAGSARAGRREFIGNGSRTILPATWYSTDARDTKLPTDSRPIEKELSNDITR